MHRSLAWHAAACCLGIAVIVSTACFEPTPTEPVDPPAAGLTVTADGRGGGGSRVVVCHARGRGDWIPLRVSPGAVPTHRRHGDALPGEAVPGMDGFVFDVACVPVPAPVACPCWNSVDEITVFMDTGATMACWLVNGIPADDGVSLFYNAGDRQVNAFQRRDGRFDCSQGSDNPADSFGFFITAEEYARCHVLIETAAAALGIPCQEVGVFPR